MAHSLVEYDLGPTYGLSRLDSTLTGSHSITLEGLVPNTTYYFRVKSKDAAGNSATSDGSTFQTLTKIEVPPSRPPILSDIAAREISADSAIIVWTTDISANSQVLYGSTTSSETQTSETNEFVTSRSISLRDLKPQTTYRYKARSVSLTGFPAVSEELTFTTKPPLDAAPPVIAQVQVFGVRPTSVKISWNTNEPTTGQIIFGKEPGQYPEQTIEIGTLSQEHEIAIADLTPETTYYFKAQSRDAAGNRASSEEQTLRTQALDIQTEIEIKAPEPTSAGAPGTTQAKTALGETSTEVPILPTLGDTEPPRVTLAPFRENPTAERSPTIRGQAEDENGVIAGVAYSVDQGETWHPVSKVTGIGTKKIIFSFALLSLKDGDYPIIARARDNSGNAGLSQAQILIVDAQPPATGGNVILLGTQPLIPSPSGLVTTLTHLTQRLIVAATGGATSVELRANPLAASGAATSSIETTPLAFPMTFSKATNLWFTDIQFPSAGLYAAEIVAADGAGKISQHPINLFHVNQPGKVLDPAGHPVQQAMITIHSFDERTGLWKIWPGDTFNQANPQSTDEQGSYRFLVPPGRYFLKVEKTGFHIFYSRILTFH